MTARIQSVVMCSCFVVLISSLCCWSAEVVFVRSMTGSSVEQHGLEVASRFYGIDLRVVTIEQNSDLAALQSAVEQQDTVALVIAADALKMLDQNTVLQWLSRRPDGGIPLMVLGVTSATGANLLKAWTNGAVGGCDQSPHRSSELIFGRMPEFTRQLSDISLPFPGRTTCYFTLTGAGTAEKLAEIRDEDHSVVPTFIRVDLGRHEMFLSAQSSSEAVNVSPAKGEDVEDVFARIAPSMMFVRYSAGDLGWHAEAHYANLTIDDPWLTEPYGYLDYEGLLREMVKHNFHTTVAFIPWNYDRSVPAVVSLFRNHPDRLSICIHGDNHDHVEFPALSEKSLGEQTEDVREALNRMTRFQELTGIKYDKIMVFPHHIGSQAILAVLKRYNFLATVNSSNVPLDDVGPNSWSFVLRPVTLEWADFPSISRVTAQYPNPTGYIAVNAFLDNPLLFYGHQDLFADGIGSFDGMADEANKIEPGTRWSSLGDIVRHLYLVRMRSDRNYDVLALSSDILLENPSAREARFFVRKRETDQATIASVTVDEQESAFKLQDNYLDISVIVPAGATRRIRIVYANALHVDGMAASKSSRRVQVLRMLSDFRDMRLSQYAVGDRFIDWYYGRHGLLLLATTCGLALMVFYGCLWSVKVVINKRRRQRGKLHIMGTHIKDVQETAEKAAGLIGR